MPTIDVDSGLDPLNVKSWIPTDAEVRRLDELERDVRSAFIDHEHKPNRYYFDNRGFLGNEPVGGYGYRDDLLARDFIELVAQFRQVVALRRKNQ